MCAQLRLIIGWRTQTPTYTDIQCKSTTISVQNMDFLKSKPHYPTIWHKNTYNFELKYNLELKRNAGILSLCHISSWFVGKSWWLHSLLRLSLCLLHCEQRGRFGYISSLLLQTVDDFRNWPLNTDVKLEHKYKEHQRRFHTIMLRINGNSVT